MPGGWPNRTLPTVVALVIVVSMLAFGPASVAAVEESEPNDSRSEAQAISDGATVTGTVSTDDEPDLYAVALERGETINASLAVEGPSGVDVDIWGPHARGIGQSGRAKNSSANAGVTARVAGTYYVAVSSLGDGTMRYSLTVRTDETDAAEPDEDRGNATVATAGEAFERQITIGDRDVYRFEATAGQEINLSTTATGPAGVEFDLMTAGGTNIGGVRAKNAADYGGATAPYSGTYYVRVNRLGGTQRLTYTLEILLSDTTDREPNEDVANATELTPNARVDDALSVGDTDWYALSVRQGDSIEISGTVAESPGVIDFGLNLPNGTSIGSEANVPGGDTYSFNATAPSTGTYYIVVDRSSRPGPAYSMTVRSNGTGDLPVESPGQVGAGDEGGDGTAGGEQAGSGGGLPLLALLLGLLALVLVIAFLVYRRRERG